MSNKNGWQVVDHTNQRIKAADGRSDAEAKVAEFPKMELEVCRKGEDPKEILDRGPQEDEDATKEVEVVSRVEDGSLGVEVQDTEGDSPAGVFNGQASSLDDPLSTLPGWMITEVSYSDRGDSTTTVNKRGCQVIANCLGLEYKTTAVTRASETDFEYSEFECTVTRPDGRTYTGHGTARADSADQGEDAGWKLDMMSETRAFKRAVKGATGGGVEAFAKEHGGQA